MTIAEGTRHDVVQAQSANKVINHDVDKAENKLTIWSSFFAIYLWSYCGWFVVGFATLGPLPHKSTA